MRYLPRLRAFARRYWQDVGGVALLTLSQYIYLWGFIMGSTPVMWGGVLVAVPGTILILRPLFAFGAKVLLRARGLGRVVIVLSSAVMAAGALLFSADIASFALGAFVTGGLVVVLSEPTG